MHLLRLLFFIQAVCQVELVVVHIPSIHVHSDLADDLSKNRLASFLCQGTSRRPHSNSNPFLLCHFCFSVRTRGLQQRGRRGGSLCRLSLAESTHQTYRAALNRLGSFEPFSIILRRSSPHFPSLNFWYVLPFFCRIAEIQPPFPVTGLPLCPFFWQHHPLLTLSLSRSPPCTDSAASP